MPSWLPRQLDGIEAAMLLADKSRLDDSVQQAFRTAGVSHLLAVSGLHLALLCGLLGFGRKWKFYRPLILLRAAAALFYLLLTGMQVSVSRAGIVLLVALVGDFFLLPPDLLTSTSFAAILLGLQNAYAPCDLGFQLSFCAVLGVQAAAELARTEQRSLIFFAPAGIPFALCLLLTLVSATVLPQLTVTLLIPTLFFGALLAGAAAGYRREGLWLREGRMTLRRQQGLYLHCICVFHPDVCLTAAQSPWAASVGRTNLTLTFPGWVKLKVRSVPLRDAENFFRFMETN